MKKYLQRWCFKQYAPMLLSLIILFVFNPANAQETNKVSGTVTNATGQPLQGASVSIKSSGKTTISDANGKFSIAASKGAVLTISFVGFENKEIKVAGTAPISVSLTVKNEALDDVVVVAYGTVKKKDLTGAVAIVNVAEAKKTASYDVAKMLQGQVAGVTVQGSGEPGGFVSIKIRGISSLSAGSDPLFVIDGVPVAGPFDFSPDDIETIQVLKDASSAALYGSRANGGVVIITTKKGRAGALKLGYTSYVGMQNVPKKIPVTNRLGYQTITNAAESNAGLSLAPGNDPTSSSYINKVNTDWQKEAFKTGIIQDHNVNFSGGNEFTTYSASLGYFDQTSSYTGPQKYNRYTINTNLQGKKGIFSYGLKLAYSQSHKVNPYNAMQYHAVFGGAVMVVATMRHNVPSH
jgi:TonB-dependent starch-binding outer membrane protein SusC